MNLSKKKVCGNCKALDAVHGNCIIGFKIHNIMSVNSGYGVAKFAPKEPCYKPLTNNDYITARKILR